jgi:transposase
MKYIQGYNRNQLALFPVSMDEAIEQDNEVRLIDLFIESLDIESMGFKVDHIENGRPAYHPKDLLKLYLYGYMNRIRSSRKLEKACRINIEKTLSSHFTSVARYSPKCKTLLPYW